MLTGVCVIHPKQLHATLALLPSSCEDESCCTAFSHLSRINGSGNSKACYLVVSDVLVLTVEVLISISVGDMTILSSCLCVCP